MYSLIKINIKLACLYRVKKRLKPSVPNKRHSTKPNLNLQRPGTMLTRIIGFFSL